MSLHFSYRHLYYFWVVGKEGGVARAAARLNMAVQTVSAQVKALEAALGYALLKPAGRGLVLTEGGAAAMQVAEQVFALGEQLPARVRDAADTPGLRLAVGISDGLPKLAVRQFLQPVMAQPNLRLLCHEGEIEDLLADLALHRLDLVLTDRTAPANRNVRVYSHSLGASPVAWYGTAERVAAARKRFPQSLAEVPVLLPTGHTALRPALDQWFEGLGVRPNVVGEFEDSALLKTFGASGLGVFPAPQLIHHDLVTRYQVRLLASCEPVQERFFAIGAEKRVAHPLIQMILQAQSPAGGGAASAPAAAPKRRARR